jgi:hypothetical protein
VQRTYGPVSIFYLFLSFLIIQYPTQASTSLMNPQNSCERNLMVPNRIFGEIRSLLSKRSPDTHHKISQIIEKSSTYLNYSDLEKIFYYLKINNTTLTFTSSYLYALFVQKNYFFNQIPPISITVQSWNDWKVYPSILLSIPSHYEIKGLNIDQISIDKNRAKSITSLHGHIPFSKLQLTKNHLDDEGLEEIIAGNILSHVIFLDLSTNWISSRGITRLAESSRVKKVETLDLSQNNVAQNGFLTILASTELQHLKVLKLRKNNISELVMREQSASFNLQQLQTLDLSYNSLGPESVRFIMNLTTHSQLTSLDLAHNNIGDEGILNLTETYPFTLTHLNLSFNRITNDGAMTLLARARNLSTLKVLDLSGNSKIHKTIIHELRVSPYFQKTNILFP